MNPIEEERDFLLNSLRDLDAEFAAGNIDDADYHTLGGLVMHQLGRVPEVGAIVELPGVKLEVVDMGANRVDRILLSRTAPPAVAADFDC